MRYADSSSEICDRFMDLRYHRMENYSDSRESFDDYEADLDIVSNNFTKSYNFFAFFNSWWRAVNDFIDEKNRSDFLPENIEQYELVKFAEEIGLKLTSQSQLVDIFWDAVALYDAWYDTAVDNVQTMSVKYSSSNNEKVL